MRFILPAFLIIFAGLFAQAECPKAVRGMESEPELSRIEAASDFSTCSDSELSALEERLMKQVGLFCPAGLKSLTALDSSKAGKEISNDDIRTLLSCASRKATLSLIRNQRSSIVPVRQAKGL